MLASVRGTVEAGRSAPWTGLLLATDRRLAFIADDEATYLPYSAIERVELGTGMIGGVLSLLTARGHEVRIKWIDSRRVRPFVRTVQAGVRAGRPRRRWRPSARRDREPLDGRGAWSEPALARLDGQLGDHLVERLDAVVDAAPAAHRDGARLGLAPAEHEHDGHLGHLGVVDLAPDLLLARVQLGAQARRRAERRRPRRRTRAARVLSGSTATCSGASQSGNAPAKCSIRMPMKRSNEPKSARWIMNGRSS